MKFNRRNKTTLERKVIDFKNKTILIIDDGAATCFTFIAGARGVRKNINPKLWFI
jgi:predicted phosphoribosyltransferase